MKVLAINSSPRTGGQSKTEMLLTPLVEGMRSAGADAEVVELRKKNINYCIGCYTCWTKTPGQCLQKDDMSQELFPKFLEADIVILASPLYYFSINAAMKTFLERTLPVAEPFIKFRGDRSFHPLRHKHPSLVVVSVAGFPENSVFDQLSSYMKFLYSRILLAEIYRAGAEFLMAPPMKDIRENILSAVHQAGVELVASRQVSPEIMARITRPLGQTQDILSLANLWWETCIANQMTPKEMEAKGLAVRPNSIETLLAMLRMVFKPEKATNINAIIQFTFSGPVSGEGVFAIGGGQVDTRLGPAEKPDLIIETPFDLWVDIMMGQADGARMFMEGKYSTQGDMNLLLKFGEWFKD